jgi:hypothetical protein
MVLLDQNKSGRKQLETKHDEKTILRTSRGPGDYIANIFTTKGRFQAENEWKRDTEAARP